MCLILFAVRAHPRYRLVVAANRDEWFHRETAPASFWDDEPQILAGRDLAQSGTWMGITRNGRFAAVTNVREGGGPRPDALSRGALVRKFLTATDTPSEFLAGAEREGMRYNGFNLVAASGDELGYYSNRGGTVQALGPGVHGVSNHLLNTDWPKVRQGKAHLSAALAAEKMEPSKLFAFLAQRGPASEVDLPSTGVPLERERGLSAPHVLIGDYGTRSATVLTVDADGWVFFSERSFDRAGNLVSAMTEEFRLAA
jgi:uncharacterized protein with NRDE domain